MHWGVEPNRALIEVDHVAGQIQTVNSAGQIEIHTAEAVYEIDQAVQVQLIDVLLGGDLEEVRDAVHPVHVQTALNVDRL